MNICGINRLLQASCDLLRAALGYAVVAVFIQIVLYAGQLAELYSCKGHHTTTTPVNTVYSRSTRPVPMAMLAAISKASIMRMVPER